MVSFACNALADAPPAPATPLRIVAFNVEILKAPGVRQGEFDKFRSDHARAAHLARVADVIETLNPDVLNLEEVISKESIDALVDILHAKGLTAYRGYHIENNDSYSGMDVALISKIAPDVVDGQPIRTYNSEADDPTWRQSFSFIGYSGDRMTRTTSLSRNAVYFMTVAGHKLGFFGLHLKSNPSDQYANAKRTAQAKVAQRVLRGEIASRGYLPVVLGDLNDYDPDVPDRDDTRDTATDTLRMLKDYDADRPGDELMNAASRIARQEDRYTSHWDWNENGARDPQDVKTMIDHILLPQQLAPYIQRVFICRGVGLDTSDHYPVVVDLLLPQVEAEP
ncbi:MAG: endonuclease/exonuclease/phosphatase family protein [Planctomycetota bacterium]